MLPSRAETYGMVVTEALARGIPVLATAVDGAAGGPRPRPGRQPCPGLLVPPDDPAALAAALRRWLTDPGLRRAAPAAARRRRGALRRLGRRPHGTWPTCWTARCAEAA